MTDTGKQLRALYFTRFASSFGLITLLTLLSEFIEVLGAEGVILGLFATGLTFAQAVGIVPISWAADRYDKRTILLGGLGMSVFVYLGFAFVGTSWQFIAVRAVQGIAATAAGLIALALVGDLARESERATTIGTSNSWRFAAAIGGTFSAGILYDSFGFDAVFTLLMLMAAAAFVVVWLWVEPDDTRIHGFPFTDLALNKRILTMTSFRAQYAVAVTLVRTWVPIYAGLEAARGGLGFEAATAISVVIAAEKFTNMLCQPYTGGLSDRFGRARFVFIGGLFYGTVAVVVPFTPAVGEALALPTTFPFLGTLSAAFIPLVALNALLGVADSIREPASMALFADEGKGQGVASSFGVRDLVWRPGSVLAPLAGGWMTSNVGIDYVFFLGGAFAFTGVFAFLGILSYTHGRDALAAW
ncbi:MFS transporter [Halosimplex litoreum]|uniref:MFS transporter n=1 Tax=Halosimplex litoreum TaxID=1198301 RepID=A0A7T3FWA8_9EURY|nr:MFS transporter [Halosimplex litoreum]QPV61880.1 MFS transporter [Halosimplex litoreum]